jgi:predicted DNA-binding protein with PD1-like motif
MVSLHGKSEIELVVVGLEPGDMLLESIQKAIDAHGIESGAIVTGFGTLKSCTMHYVTHNNFPPTDKLYTLNDKPMELLSMNGTIAEGKPHIHIALSSGDKEMYGGHLENNSEVLYLGEVVIMKFSKPKLVRKLDQERKIMLLQPDSN